MIFKQLQLLIWRYVCVMDAFTSVELYLTVTHSTTCSTSSANVNYYSTN